MLIGSAASEGGSVRGSACYAPARLRFTSLRPSSCGCYALNRGPGRCGGFHETTVYSSYRIGSYCPFSGL